MFIDLDDQKREKCFQELVHWINTNSLENGSNTPDFILADFLLESLILFEKINQDKKEWGQVPDPGEMDGDAKTALASAGWGTDEDYGGTDERI